MKLWTIQTRDWWHFCQKQRHLIADRDYEEEYFKKAYAWMHAQMEKRIGPSPNSILWAWYRYRDEKRPAPDLRCGGHLKKGTPAVCIEFELSEDKALLTDFENWHFPLNDWYLGNDRKLSKKLDTYVGKKYPKYIRKAVEKTWDKIFVIKKGRPIQATLWEIPQSGIINVRFFITR